ncbi:unnamed protein product [Ectocarpus sp. CCAP 1310/34]|nr:unnamed protein product [Ectocarpus sp. CCAP 1310/34]
MAAAGRGWKCGVCNAKAGDLVCGACVTREAERRRAERAKRLGALESVREVATVAAQERGVAVQHNARLQKEEADECRLKDHVREVAKRVAEERIKVASAAFALKHHRDLLAAAESHLSREQASAAEMNEALLVGLRRHAEDAARTLRQRRWRKVVQLFVLLPVDPSMPPRRERPPKSKKSWGGADHSPGTAPSTAEGEEGRGVIRLPPPGGGVAKAGGGGAGEVVSGVSTLVDLPLPNNGDYSRECSGRMRVPAEVLMASLTLVARLVASVASCLGVSLPHPLFPAASTRYATISVDSSPRERSSQYPLCPLSKLAEIGVMGAASAVCKTMGAFDTALDLLRNDIVHLCVEGANVPVDSLWPAEALLLNLWELQQHAMSELRSSSPMVDVPLPMPRDPPERKSAGFHRHGSRGGASGSRDRASAKASAQAPDGYRRRKTAGMRSRLGLGLGFTTATSTPPPPPATEAGTALPGGGMEEDYEFVGGGDGGGSGGDDGVEDDDGGRDRGKLRSEEADNPGGSGWRPREALGGRLG